MAVVITVAQQKGGAGKTTLAANLAAIWATRRRVGMLDIDPQRSLARWHALRQQRTGLATCTFSEVSGWRLGRELDRLREEADIVVVDTPPQIDSDARRAVRMADLVLIPIQPSVPDLWAAEGTLALAQAERRPVCLMFNRSAKTSKLRDEIAAEVGRRGIRLLGAALGNRQAYAQAFARGMGVTEAAPRSLAAEEMRVLVAAIEEIVG